ncbi:MAG TPA: hypothetical protein VIV40_40930 [Kofleriaceae bacterium]
MGNKYGVSPFEMLELIGPLVVIGPLLIWMLVFGPLLLYPIARWKAHRAQLGDTQLGVKFALHFFALIAFQLVLFALAMVIYTLFSKSEFKGELYRAGFGFLIPSAGVLATHYVLLKRTNQDQFPDMRRLFLGYNLILTGLLGFATLLYAFQIFFKKGSAGDDGRFAIASVLVYVGAWVACGVQYARLVLGDGTAAPPANLIPPNAPTHTTAQPSGPVLPSLSTGTFPPLDQK